MELKDLENFCTQNEFTLCTFLKDKYITYKKNNIDLMYYWENKTVRISFKDEENYNYTIEIIRRTKLLSELKKYYKEFILLDKTKINFLKNISNSYNNILNKKISNNLKNIDYSNNKEYIDAEPFEDYNGGIINYSEEQLEYKAKQQAIEDFQDTIDKIDYKELEQFLGE